MPPGELSLLDAFTVLLRNRRLILGVALLAALVSVVITLATDRRYTATASFVPQAQSGGSELQSLAARFGLPVTSNASWPPRFYADLLHSRTVLIPVLEREYSLPSEPPALQGRPLLDRIDVTTDDPDLRLTEGLEVLRKATTVDVNRETGLVEFSVSLPSRHLAKEVADQLLAELHRFNIEMRQSQATEERKFAEERLEQAREELRQVQEEMRVFLENNRSFEGSPAKQFDYQGLMGRIAQRQELISSLMRSYEQARISEVRDTPVLTVVDAPKVPAEPDSRRGLVRLLLALLLGGFLGTLAAFGREFVRGLGRTSDDRVEQFLAAGREARRDVVRPWKLLGVSRPAGGE